MSTQTELKPEIKRMMVETLMLQVEADTIADDLPLFGPGGLGLDSVDALQLVVALDKQYGLKIPDPEAAKRILQSVQTIAHAIAQAGNPPNAAPPASSPLQG
jgi:acyl carrier protein